MARRDLAGQHQLGAQDQIGGGADLEIRMLETDEAAERFLLGDMLRSLEQGLLDILPSPLERAVLGFGLAEHRAGARDHPIADQIAAPDILFKGFAFAAIGVGLFAHLVLRL